MVTLVDDSALAVALAIGDRDALDAIYRRYADRLVSYAATIVGDRDSASDAVHDAFLLASRHAGGLRDPARLRPWLYAITRSVALRQIRHRARVGPMEAFDQLSAPTVDLSARLHADEIGELVRAAGAGLSGADREVVELAIRHGLASTEVAAALGISIKHANARLSRARSSLTDALGALLVARTPSSCQALADLLLGWDGALTPLLRKRLHRHIEDCADCAAIRSSRMDPRTLLSVFAALPFPPASAATQPGRPPSGTGSDQPGPQSAQPASGTRPDRPAADESRAGPAADRARQRIGSDVGSAGIELRWDPATGFPQAPTRSAIRSRPVLVGVLLLVITSCVAATVAAASTGPPVAQVTGSPAARASEPVPPGSVAPTGPAARSASPQTSPTGGPASRLPSPRRSPPATNRPSLVPPMAKTAVTDFVCTSAGGLRLVIKVYSDTALATVILYRRIGQAQGSQSMTLSGTGRDASTSLVTPTTEPITWWIQLATVDGRELRTPERVATKSCGP